MFGFYGPPKVQKDALHAIKMLQIGLESAADALFDAGAYDAWASARAVLNCPEIPDSSVVKKSLIPAANLPPTSREPAAMAGMAKTEPEP